MAVKVEVNFRIFLYNLRKIAVGLFMSTPSSHPEERRERQFVPTANRAAKHRYQNMLLAIEILGGNFISGETSAKKLSLPALRIQRFAWLEGRGHLNKVAPT